MEHLIYRNILFASFVVMYAYALFFLTTRIPQGKEYDNYKVSRKLFCANMIMWATYLVVHWRFNLRLNNPPLAYALCFSCYFPGIMLFEMTFSSLISRSYQVGKYLKRTIINTIVVNIIIFGNYLFLPRATQHIVFYIIAVVFIIEMAFLSARFSKNYRTTLKEADNYYSDNTDIFIRWMPTSIYIAIIFGFAGSVLSFASNGSVSIYMLGGLLLFTYIFISYQNYMINITQLKELLLTENSELPSSDIKEEGYEILDLETRITKWIASRGFCKQGFTIEDAAMELGTNRTYLSSYINNSLNLSFREWIAVYRIRYAKELLRGNQELQTSKIAEIVGYSTNAFIANFSKSEQMTPLQWRNANQE